MGELFAPSNSVASLVLLPLLICCARIVDVSLGTLRIIFVSKGFRLMASVMGFFEVLIWIIGISQVMQNLDSMVNYFAYAFGFAAGSFVGMTIERRLSLGMVIIHVITALECPGVDRLHAQGRLWRDGPEFRPFPVAALRAALAGVRDVLVLDRNFSPGAGGVLDQELRAALFGMPSPPRVHGLLAGVGGVNVPPQKIVELALAARGREPAAEPAWAN